MVPDFPFGVPGVMSDVLAAARQVAGSHAPVLIEGARGTGKEALARYIHRLRGGSNPFVRLYCGQPEKTPFLNSPEAEGLLSGTAAGTLFLKHVHLLAPPLQTRLMTFLESDSREAHVRDAVRVIASTTVTSSEFVRPGRSSADLYFRLSAFRIVLPRLAERREQIPELLTAILRRIPVAHGIAKPFDARVLKVLMHYPWPGNIRELENFARSFAIATDPSMLISQLEEGCGNRSFEPEALVTPLKEQVRDASRRLEEEIIRRTLERRQWNRRQTARVLQISYRALLYKMKDLRLTERSAVESNYV